MALLKFLKGNYASMSTAAIVEGQVLICGDTGEMFVDVTADKRVKIGDYVTVASLDALMAIDATAVPTSRLYYVEGANILARSNGTTWDQINKDTGATSIEVVGEGNAVTAASYDAVTRKLTLTKGETFATKAELDDLDAFVGDIPDGYTETNVIAYINKKAEETLNAASGGSTESAASVKAALDTEVARAKAAEEANATAAANAQKAADDAQDAVDTLAQTHATDKEALEGAIALKANAADVYTKTEIDGKVDTINDAIAAKAAADDVYTKDDVDGMVSDLEAADLAINNKIGDVAADKTIVQMIEEAQSAATYDDSAVRGLIDTNAQAIAKEIEDREGAVSGLQTALEGQIATKVEQSDYDEKVAALEGEDARLAGLIGDNTTAINGVSGKVDTLVGEDTGKSVRTIANEELAAQLIAEGAKESLDTLQEIAAWIQEHPDDASAMNAAIEALQAKVDTGDQTVSAYVAAAINALNIGDYATAAALAEAVARIDALETASATHATKDELQTVADDLDAYEQAHNADYDNATVDAKVKAVQDQIDALGDTYATDAELEAAMNAEVERANGLYATQANLTTHVDDAVKHITAEERTAWNGAQAAAEATAAAALATARTEITAEIATAKGEAISDAEGKIASAKAEAIADAEGKIAIAKSEAIADAEGKVNAAKTELQGNIDTVSGALNTYKTENDAAVALKADASAVYTKAEVEDLMSWGSF